MVSRIAIFLAALMVVGGMAHAANYEKEADIDGTIGRSFGSTPDYLNVYDEGDLRIGAASWWNRAAILKFNINWAQVPTAITSATLQIDTMSVNADCADVKVALVTEDWTGTYPETTWISRTDPANWTTPGGSPATATQVSVSLTAPTEIDVDLTSMIQHWQANQSSYYGIVIYDDTVPTSDPSGYSRIYSTESDAELHRHPTLVIVPEPVSLSLLALGGIGVLLRRRR